MIGYYVHHHGAGHHHRALAVARHLGDDVTLLGSLHPGGSDHVPFVRLPHDDEPEPGDDADVTAGGTLHWAPLRHSGQQARAAALSSWLAGSNVSVFVSDVSVEAVLLARLLSVPPVAVALRGDRLDRAHATGYDCAVRILAPWTRATQHRWPERWLTKTTWTGMISRFDARPRHQAPCGHVGLCVVLLLGSGGHGMTGADLDEAGAVPDVHWHVLGHAGEGSSSNPTVLFAGHVPDPWPHLCAADVVVAAAGDAAVADVAAARAPLVAVPQDRPFREQVEHVRLLADHGLCVAAAPWPRREEWPRLLRSALEIGGDRWAEVSDGLGAQRAAAVLRDLAVAVPGRRVA
jgi:hypothetical protein